MLGCLIPTTLSVTPHCLLLGFETWLGQEVTAWIPTSLPPRNTVFLMIEQSFRQAKVPACYGTKTLIIVSTKAWH
jgi:hypothetical protein